MFILAFAFSLFVFNLSTPESEPIGRTLENSKMQNQIQKIVQKAEQTQYTKFKKPMIDF